ncbi:hypothetical protein [Marinovum sp.]
MTNTGGLVKQRGDLHAKAAVDVAKNPAIRR